MTMLKNAIPMTDNDAAMVIGGASKTYYVIKRGDTLTRIAHRYGTTVKKLMDMNHQITNANLIHTGATIRVS